MQLFKNEKRDESININTCTHSFQSTQWDPNLQFSWHSRRAFRSKINFFYSVHLAECSAGILCLSTSQKSYSKQQHRFSHLSVSNLHLHKAIINRLHSSVVFMFIQVLSPLSWDRQWVQFSNWDLQNAPLFIRTDPISSKGFHWSDTTIKWAVATLGKSIYNNLGKVVW